MNIKIVIWLCICLFVSSLSPSAVFNNSQNIEKEFNAGYFECKVVHNDVSGDDENTQGIQFKYADIKLKKSNSGKNISVKRFKNKSDFAGSGRNNLSKQTKQVAYENSGFTYVDLAFLKFLIITKCLS